MYFTKTAKFHLHVAKQQCTTITTISTFWSLFNSPTLLESPKAKLGFSKLSWTWEGWALLKQAIATSHRPATLRDHRPLVSKTTKQPCTISKFAMLCAYCEVFRRHSQNIEHNGIVAFTLWLIHSGLILNTIGTHTHPHTLKLTGETPPHYQ